MLAPSSVLYSGPKCPRVGSGSEINHFPRGHLCHPQRRGHNPNLGFSGVGTSGVLLNLCAQRGSALFRKGLFVCRAWCNLGPGIPKSRVGGTDCCRWTSRWSGCLYLHRPTTTDFWLPIGELLSSARRLRTKFRPRHWSGDKSFPIRMLLFKDVTSGRICPQVLHKGEVLVD
jgi:hypothetical protein